MLWSNLFLLFWLSVVPFVVRWLNESDFAAGPLRHMSCSGARGNRLDAYRTRDHRLQRAAIRHRPRYRIGLQRPWKHALYALAMPLAFVSRWLATALYLAVIALWLIPDRRIARVLEESSRRRA